MMIMIKKVLALTVVAVFIAACGNNATNNTTVSDNPEAAEVTFASLTENPGDYVGKEITVEGKVVHVCMNSGKKMYIVGEDPDIRLFISAGDNVTKFPTDLLGSVIKVTGVFQKVEAGAEMEKEHEDSVEGEACETEEAMAKQTVLADMMLSYKEHTVK